MAAAWKMTVWRALPVLVCLGGAAACRDGGEKAREEVLISGFRFTIDDFLKAAQEGRGGVVEQFLAAGMKVDAVGAGGATALRLAAGQAQGHLVEKLLAAGAAVDRADAAGVTPLIAAAEAGDGISVRALAKGGAVMSLKDRKGRTALDAAAAAGRAEVVEFLVPESEGSLEPVLLLACAAGHTGVIDGLLKVEGGTLPGGGSRDWPAMLRAAAEGGHLAAVRLLSSRVAARPEAAAWRRDTAALATAAGRNEVAAFLESEADRAEQALAGAPLNEPTPTPLAASVTVAANGQPAPAEAAGPTETGVGGPTGSSAGSVENQEAAEPGKMLDPRAAGPAKRPSRLAGKRFPTVDCDAMEDVGKWLKMVAWEPQTWPVVLKDVSVGHETAEVLLTEEPSRVVTLRVGDEIPGTGCVIEKLRRRRLYTDATETVLKNVSELHFRRVSTGEVFQASPEESVLSNQSTALLKIAGTSQDWGAVPGDDFRLGSLLLSVKRIAKASLELENRLTRETVAIPLSAP